MRESIVKSTMYVWYDSMEEYACDAMARLIKSGAINLPKFTHAEDHFRGATMEETWEMAKSGWTEDLAATLALAEEAVSMMEQSHEVQTFSAVHDYSGADVDISRYLSGDPENMIDYPLMTVSTTGKVVTLVVGGSVSAAVGSDSIKRRGQVIAAFALALSRLGHACEIWFDDSTRGSAAVRRGQAPKVLRTRILVKGTDDEIDPARIMFGVAHPAVCRGLWFAWVHGLPPQWQKALEVGSGYGTPINPEEGNGAICLPALRSSSDVPDADVLLRDLLRRVGLLAE